MQSAYLPISTIPCHISRIHLPPRRKAISLTHGPRHDVLDGPKETCESLLAKRRNLQLLTSSTDRRSTGLAIDQCQLCGASANA